MNRQQERDLLSKAKIGDESSRAKLIEGLMHQVKYIAKDYVNKGLDWDDIVQEGRIGLIKAIDYILKKDDFEVRVWTYAKRKVRDSIRNAFYNFANTIRQPKSFIKKQRLLAAANSLSLSIIQETNYDNNNELEYLDVHQDNWNRLTLHDKIMEVLDLHLTLEEADVIMLKFGFGHEYFDTPDWQKPNKPLTLKKIAAIVGVSTKNVTKIINSAMEKLQQEEVKYQLLPWRR